MIIGVTAVCALLSLFDIGKMRKMDTGRRRVLAIYFALMLTAIILLIVFIGLDDFSLAESSIRLFESE